MKGTCVVLSAILMDSDDGVGFNFEGEEFEVLDELSSCDEGPDSNLDVITTLCTGPIGDKAHVDNFDDLHDLESGNDEVDLRLSSDKFSEYVTEKSQKGCVETPDITNLSDRQKVAETCEFQGALETKNGGNCMNNSGEICHELGKRSAVENEKKILENCLPNSQNLIITGTGKEHVGNLTQDEIVDMKIKKETMSVVESGKGELCDILSKNKDDYEIMKLKVDKGTMSESECSAVMSLSSCLLLSEKEVEQSPGKKPEYVKIESGKDDKSQMKEVIKFKEIGTNNFGKLKLECKSFLTKTVVENKPMKKDLLTESKNKNEFAKEPNVHKYINAISGEVSAGKQLDDKMKITRTYDNDEKPKSESEAKKLVLKSAVIKTNSEKNIGETSSSYDTLLADWKFELLVTGLPPKKIWILRQILNRSVGFGNHNILPQKREDRFLHVFFESEVEMTIAYKLINNESVMGYLMKAYIVNKGTIKRKAEETSSIAPAKKTKLSSAKTQDQEKLALSAKEINMKPMSLQCLQGSYRNQIMTKFNDIKLKLSRLGKFIGFSYPLFSGLVSRREFKHNGIFCELDKFVECPSVERQLTKCKFSIDVDEETKKPIVGFSEGSNRKVLMSYKKHNYPEHIVNAAKAEDPMEECWSGASIQP